MNPNQQSLLELAKQGNSKAIAALINRSLQPKGINAKANLKGSCLQILVESDKLLDQELIVEFLVSGIEKLNIKSIDSLKIFGKQNGQGSPAWTQDVSLQSIPEEFEILESSLSGDSNTAKKSRKNGTLSTSSQVKPKLNATDHPSSKNSSEDILIRFKVRALSVLKAAWKWYISGFRSRPDLPLFLSPRLYRILFTFFVFIWITTPLGWYENTTSSTSAPSSSRETTAKLECDSAAGRMWTNVRLYHDAECTRPFGTIVGGGKLRNGERGVLIRFDTGELEWKTRRAVMNQSYVRTDDPAHSAKLWRDLNE